MSPSPYYNCSPWMYVHTLCLMCFVNIVLLSHTLRVTPRTSDREQSTGEQSRQHSYTTLRNRFLFLPQPHSDFPPTTQPPPPRRHCRSMAQWRRRRHHRNCREPVAAPSETVKGSLLSSPPETLRLRCRRLRPRKRCRLQCAIVCASRRA